MAKSDVVGDLLGSFADNGRTKGNADALLGFVQKVGYLSEEDERRVEDGNLVSMGVPMSSATTMVTAVGKNFSM